MAQPIPDMWPNDLDVPAVRTPLAVLREVAARLAEKTDRLVGAVVLPHPVSTDGMFGCSLELFAPALGNYRYSLFTVRYPLDFYPLELSAPGVFHEPRKASSEAEFLGLLQLVLSSTETRRVLSSLLAQSRSLTPAS